MKILFTFDYEIFFGKQQGSVDECILKPSLFLFDLAKKYNEKLIFFVDIGYLIKLKEYGKKYPKLSLDYKNICHQLKFFVHNGHSVQLHIHSHWENSYYKDNNWVLDYSHYKLQSYSENEISEIISKYKSALEEIIGKNVFAYRAGGWCIQPFNLIKDALLKNNIRIDSTVISKSNSENFDFSRSPDKTFWNFDNDPSIEQKKGSFLEVPISSLKVSQLFYWKLLLKKLLKSKKTKTEGDGSPMNPPAKSILNWLFNGNYMTVSSDGIKSGLMIKALRIYERKYSENDIFTIIGHPKTLNNYSIKKIEEFFEYFHEKHNTIDYNYFREMNIIP